MGTNANNIISKSTLKNNISSFSRCTNSINSGSIVVSNINFESIFYFRAIIPILCEVTVLDEFPSPNPVLYHSMV